MGTEAEFFSDALVVVGSCIAGRAWRVWPDGELTGVTYWQPWQTRGNEAYCPYIGAEGLRQTIPQPAAWRGQVGGSGFVAHGPEKRIPHKSGAMGCSCGWWSYHDLSMSASWALGGLSGRRVVGVIQAYGLMTRGTKGYRSQYADILALVRPQWADLEPVADEVPPADLWGRVLDRYSVPAFSSIDAAATAIRERNAA